MNTISLEAEETLLKKAGYSDSAIKIYKDLKAMDFKAFNGQEMAEAFLRLLDLEKAKASGESK